MGGPAFTNTTPFVNAGIGADLIAALDEWEGLMGAVARR
jgi:hypothetical protein